MIIQVFFLLPFMAYLLIYLQNKEKLRDLQKFLDELTDFFVLREEEIEDLKDKIEEVKDAKEKKEIKYEEKYMEKLHQMSREIIFTEEEELLKEQQYNSTKKIIQNKIPILEKEIEELNRKKLELEEKISIKKANLEMNNSEDSDLEEDLHNYEYLLTNVVDNIKILEEELKHYLDQNSSDDELYETIRQNIIQQRVEKLKNCFTMEKTPLGNVAMYYNANRETFEYYSDNTIPYRFLEVVARKYVTTFNCPYLYVMMDEELKKYEKKLEEQEEKKRLQEEEEKQKQPLIQNTSQSTNKKNVFAKFKSYNKEAGSGRVNKAPPPKNSIPNNSKTNTANNNDKIILKENANRYTYEGRFANFSPLQKIERKKVDKKYALSFADFKKMQKK
jgi:hypothetical protein